MRYSAQASARRKRLGSVDVVMDWIEHVAQVKDLSKFKKYSSAGMTTILFTATLFYPIKICFFIFIWKVSANTKLAFQKLIYFKINLHFSPQRVFSGGSLGQQPPENSKHFTVPQPPDSSAGSKPRPEQARSLFDHVTWPSVGVLAALLWVLSTGIASYLGSLQS